MTAAECEHGEPFGDGFACPACQPKSLRQLSTELDLPEPKATVTATFPSRCPRCDESIRSGDLIHLSEDGWVCTECAT